MTLPVFLYLCRDILFRWREAPFSLLAKSVVVGLLAGMAAVILISFHLSTEEMRRSLEAAGANSVIVHEFVPRERLAERKWVVEAMEGFRPTVIHHLEKLPLTAESDFKGGIMVFLVDGDEPWYRMLARAEASLLLLTDEFSAGIRLPVRIGGGSLESTVAPKPEWFTKLASGPVLVAPRDDFLKQAGFGLESFTYLEIAGGRERVSAAVNAIALLAVDAGYRGVTIRDPLAMIKRLDELQAGQDAWRTAIVFGFGGTLALVLGVIAFLEFRERRFVCALLRSFGLHEGVILMRYATDALLLCNAVLLLVTIGVLAFAPQILPSLGVSAQAIAAMDGADFFLRDGLVLVGFVNAGAILSVLPTALGLRRPIGRVLS